jgi:hypothetical protein
MNHDALPPTPPHEPDEMDRLFAAYFAQQLPEPWPEFRPTPTANVRTARPTSGRSRLTLAASVAALLGLGLLVSSGPRPAPHGQPVAKHGTSLLPQATANGSELQKHMNQTPDAGHQNP